MKEIHITTPDGQLITAGQIVGFDNCDGASFVEVTIRTAQKDKRTIDALTELYMNLADAGALLPLIDARLTAAVIEESRRREREYRDGLDVVMRPAGDGK